MIFAVYREDVDELVAAAPALLAEHEPPTALAVDARDVILLISYLTRLEPDEWDTRARHLL